MKRRPCIAILLLILLLYNPKQAWREVLEYHGYRYIDYSYGII